jgi:catechol 2,3-dioxygenase-like lactoylglutathione lyase family enzyme
MLLRPVRGGNLDGLIALHPARHRRSLSLIVGPARGSEEEVRGELIVSRGQFRFSYFTPDYESTVAFYRDGLDLRVLESWDRDADDRGALFAAASGIIEILARPRGGDPSHFWDDRPPQGAFMVIEVESVEQTYRRAIEKGLPIQQHLTTQAWGHRSFCVREPNGLTLYFFAETKNG